MAVDILALFFINGCQAELLGAIDWLEAEKLLNFIPDRSLVKIILLHRFFQTKEMRLTNGHILLHIIDETVIKLERFWQLCLITVATDEGLVARLEIDEE